MASGKADEVPAPATEQEEGEVLAGRKDVEELPKEPVQHEQAGGGDKVAAMDDPAASPESLPLAGAGDSAPAGGQTHVPSVAEAAGAAWDETKRAVSSAAGTIGEAMSSAGQGAADAAVDMDGRGCGSQEAGKRDAQAAMDTAGRGMTAVTNAGQGAADAAAGVDERTPDAEGDAHAVIDAGGGANIKPAASEALTEIRDSAKEYVESVKKAAQSQPGVAQEVAARLTGESKYWPQRDL